MVTTEDENGSALLYDLWVGPWASASRVQYSDGAHREPVLVLAKLLGEQQTPLSHCMERGASVRQKVC